MAGISKRGVGIAPGYSDAIASKQSMVSLAPSKPSAALTSAGRKQDDNNVNVKRIAMIFSQVRQSFYCGTQ
jgi:hypothetical protein